MTGGLPPTPDAPSPNGPPVPLPAALSALAAVLWRTFPATAIHSAQYTVAGLLRDGE
jgi:hypothetical protein